MTALYTNREGQTWELQDPVPSLFPGFWVARRLSDGKLVHVHEHRIVWPQRHEDTKERQLNTETREVK